MLSVIGCPSFSETASSHCALKASWPLSTVAVRVPSTTMLSVSSVKFSSAAAAVSDVVVASDVVAVASDVVVSAVCVSVVAAVSADVDPQAAREATIAVDRINDKTFFFIKMFLPVL